MEKVNLDMLVSAGISADEYIFLKLLKEERYQSLEKVKNLLTVQIDKLVKKGYLRRDNLKATYLHERYSIRARFNLDFYGNTDSMWAEIVSTYPHKVPSPSGGTRVLHAQDADALSNQKAKTRYLKAINNDVKVHRRVVAALKRELHEKRSNLQYLRNLNTWVNNYGWEEFDYHDNEEVISRNTAPKTTSGGANYGQGLK